MYQDLFKDVKHNFQPMLEVAAINRKTLARMASVQSHCLSEFISTGINQIKDLSTAGDAKTLADLQFKYLREFENKLAASAEENISVMSEAKDEISEVLTSTYGQMARTTPFGDMLKGAEESTTMPVPVKDKTPARRAAKSTAAKVEAAPKVEVKGDTKTQSPKVEVKDDTKADASKTETKAQAKSEPKSEAKVETKTGATQAEAKRDAAKEEAPKAEAKSDTDKSESTKSGSSKTTAKSKSGTGAKR